MAKFAAGFVGPRTWIAKSANDDTDFFLRLTQENAAAVRRGEKQHRHRPVRGRTMRHRRPATGRLIYALAGASFASIIVSTMWMVFVSM